MARGSDDAAWVALHDLEALLASTRRLAGLLDTAVLAQRAAHEVRRVVGTEIATLALRADPGLLIMRGTSGVRTSSLAGLRIPRGTGVGGKILVERRPIALEDYAHDGAITRDLADVVVEAEGIRGLVGVPIEHEDEVIGILYGGHRSIGYIGERGQSMLLELARSLGPLLGSTQQADDARQLSVQGERQRIALDLHDTIGQLLFGIGAAARRAQDGLPGESADLLTSLRDIEAGASRAASYLRDALRSLAPATPEEALATVIRMDASAFTDRSGVPVHVVVVGEPFALPSPVQAALLAVVREGLHNVEKYAGASSAILTLHYRLRDGERRVGIIVQDDGVGLPADFALQPLPQGGRRWGLTSLHQQVQRLGGDLAIIANEDGGVTLRASIPVRAGAP
jgi:LuxR family transcriptional regulator, regulator of acetate metabolism